MPLSAPICSAFLIASAASSGPTVRAVTSTSSPPSPEAAFSLSWRACSTAYSSSSESRPGTPTRSTVLSDSKCRSAVASGTYFTQTTMFMNSITALDGPLLNSRDGWVDPEVRLPPSHLGRNLSGGCGQSQRAVGSAGALRRDQVGAEATDEQVHDGRDPPVEQGVLGLCVLAAEVE